MLAPVCIMTFALYVLFYFQTKAGGHAYRRMNIFCLAPVFGALNSVAVRRGLGSVGFGTTDQVLTTSSALADVCFCKEVARPPVVKALLMIAGLIIGAMCGT